MREKEIHLKFRLLNCLQTIVDIEDDLSLSRVDDFFLREFRMLKKVIARIDAYDLNEEDVSRVEKAASTFLQELSVPLKSMHGRSVSGRRVH